MAHRLGDSNLDPSLIVTASNWHEQPSWFQPFSVDETTITGFVTSCDGCEEECEAETCD